jgi:hypothetical protein
VVNHHLLKMASVDEKLDKILEKLHKLDILENKVDTLNGHFEQEIKDIKSEIHSIKQNCLRNENIRAERDRRYNLLFFGVKGGNFFTMSEEILNVLKFLVPEVDGSCIGDLWRTNKMKDKSPVVVKLNSIIIRNMILRKKRMLNGEHQFNHIHIKEDFTKETRVVRKQLFQHLMRLKEEGKKVIMIKDTLKVDGKIVSLEELDSQEAQTSKRARSEETSPKIQEEQNRNDHGKQTIKRGRKMTRNDSLDRFFTKNRAKNTETTNEKQMGQDGKRCLDEERAGGIEDEEKGDETLQS